MKGEHFLAVDRVHENDAVILDDHGRAFTVPLKELPEGVAARSVLRVVVADDGEPDWASAAVDEGETERRKRLSGRRQPSTRARPSAASGSRLT
jgi:hypothetical protein